MKYIELTLLWCLASFIAMGVEFTFFEYSPSFMIHFFVGMFVILIFEMIEAIKKDKERNKRLRE